jgi:UDP:flavonoid glycosyltransferase YjiC (YdhE family)
VLSQVIGLEAREDGRVELTRMLFTCRPLAGHFEPLLPLASEAAAGGHAVAFATGEPYASRAEDAGFEPIVDAWPPDILVHEVAELAALPTRRQGALL